jgi:hypothetical protein
MLMRTNRLNICLLKSDSVNVMELDENLYYILHAVFLHMNVTGFLCSFSVFLICQISI